MLAVPDQILSESNSKTVDKACAYRARQSKSLKALYMLNDDAVDGNVSSGLYNDDYINIAADRPAFSNAPAQSATRSDVFSLSNNVSLVNSRSLLSSYHLSQQIQTNHHLSSLQDANRTRAQERSVYSSLHLYLIKNFLAFGWPLLLRE